MLIDVEVFKIKHTFIFATSARGKLHKIPISLCPFIKRAHLIHLTKTRNLRNAQALPKRERGGNIKSCPGEEKTWLSLHIAPQGVPRKLKKTSHSYASFL